MTPCRTGRRRPAGFTATLALALALALAWLAPFSEARGQERIHSVFFAGSDHELNVYRIVGKEPGRTLMLIGGIQGDEPGGFLSVDHYADISLQKGHLIVVPRANLRSIVLNRRAVNTDMNRQFAEGSPPTYETEIVEILKKLISESDCLLNLHDGSGFYSETWHSQDRNPDRFGQSIIADAETFPTADTGRVLDLGTIARQVCRQINLRIKEPRYHFHFNNHRTARHDTRHREQRKSATYFALTVCGIPAFGIETSKDLPLELKIRHHNLAINAFMQRFGVLPETPGLNLKPPKLAYLVVSVNGRTPVVVNNQQTLLLSRGDILTISHIEANYERGLTADILGLGGLNDLRKKIAVAGPTRIVVRKDFMPCGSVYIELGATPADGGGVALTDGRPVIPGGLFFKIRHAGRTHLFANHGQLQVVRGDRFEIRDIITGGQDPSELVVNLKGYVSDPSNNTGEDRGCRIDTAKDLWPRYALDEEKRQYRILVSDKGRTLGKLTLMLVDPVMHYLVVESRDGRRWCLRPGETLQCDDQRGLRVIDILSNVTDDPLPAAFWQPAGGHRRPLAADGRLPPAGNLAGADRTLLQSGRIEILRQDLHLGTVFVNPLQESDSEE